MKQFSLYPHIKSKRFKIKPLIYYFIKTCFKLKTTKKQTKNKKLNYGKKTSIYFKLTLTINSFKIKAQNFCCSFDVLVNMSK